MVFMVNTVFANSEADEVLRISQSGKLVQKNSNVFFCKQNVTAMFYSDTSAPEMERGIAGVLLTEDNKKILLSLYENNGGMPTIADVFNYKVSGSDNENLFIICSWEQNHSGLGISGVYYEIFIYSGNTASEKGYVIALLNKSLMKEIGQGFDGVQEGETVEFKYKDRKSIVAKLSGVQPDAETK
jgi:hypothetical protein